MTARSEDDLLGRTLVAAMELTGAAVAVVLEPEGAARAHGEAHYAERLSELDAAALRSRPDAALSRAGLAAPLVADLGDVTMLLAAGEGGALRADATCVLDLVVAHAHAARERLREMEQLTHRANRDPLTGLHHHRPFAERLAECRPGRTAVITLDIDRFKKINDEHGHEAGDHALITLVDAMRGALRDEDQLYRIGGDEFAVIVDVNGPAEAVAIARRLLAAARRVGQTVSAGAALHAPGETARQTLVRADRALYEAKRAGRDTARLAA